MSYTLYNSDGTILTIIADGNVDKFTTNLTLVGKNVASYGQYINENFVTVLSNGASTPQDKPLNPLPGQLWYDIVNSQLNIFDTNLSWRNVIGAEINPNLPTNLGIGDFWFDQINKQLHIKPNASTATWVIGPAFSSTIGGNGWVLPMTTITDIDGIPQNITLLENYGKIIGLISSNQFVMSSSDSMLYFNTDTPQAVVAGLNMFGDIYYTGNIADKGLSITVNLQSLFPQYFSDGGFGPINPYDYNQLISIQNPGIQRLLMTAFPPVNAQKVPFIDLKDQKGFPVGSEANVIVYTPKYYIDAHTGQISPPTPGLISDDHHVRRFRIVYDHGIGQNRWDAVMVYPVPTDSTFTTFYISTKTDDYILSNVVPDFDTNQSNQTWVNVPTE
jgi:hypothetical protein